MESLKSKLPVKRKTPDLPHPFPSSPNELRPPPFKFHRIWTEHDEIRFLQGLLNPTPEPNSSKLSFPRDLSVFYSRFSASMSQPYTKSQLSEKLRRLRKKFRVISARLAKGLDPSLLSPHDRDLYALSKRLWHPEFAASSPFSAASCVGGSNVGGEDGGEEGGLGLEEKGRLSGLVGVKVEFLPDLEMKCEDGGIENEDGGIGSESAGLFEGVDGKDGVEGRLSEVDVKFEDCIEVGDDQGMENGGELGECNGDVEGNGFVEFCGGEVRRVGNGGVSGFKVKEERVRGDVSVDEVAGGAAKIVMSVFSEAVEEVRKGIVNGDLEMRGEESFEKRWQEQWGAELDVFAQRMRLILENSIPKV